MVGSSKANVDDDHQNNLMKDDIGGGGGGGCGDRRDDHDGDEDEFCSSGVSCSICLDLVLDNGGRSRAQLQCGHEFHLDCIGSAFNMKGAMQCPNCRNVEKGQWLYANGSNRSSHEFIMDEWIPEDFYDLNYFGMPYHWCPYGELDRAALPFEEVESPSTTHHDLRGHHPMYSEHTAASPMAHSHVAYVGPVQPTLSRSNDSIEDPNYHHWNVVPGRYEIFNPHTSSIHVQHHIWSRRPALPVLSSHVNGADPASVPPLTFRSSNVESDTGTRSTPFLHPVVFGHGSGAAASSSFVSSIIPSHIGSGAQAHERRIQVSRAINHQRQSSNPPGMPMPIIHAVRRVDGPRNSLTVLPAPPRSGSFFVVPSSGSSHQSVHELESPWPHHLHAWQREHSTPFHQNTGGTESDYRSRRHW